MQLSEDEIKQKLSALRRGGRRLATPAVTSPSTAAASPLDGAASADVAASPQASAAPAAPAPNIVGGTVLPTDGPAPIERLRTAVASRRAEGEPLDEGAAGRVVEFLNAELGDEMLGWLLRWTEVGDKARRRNMWSRGSWTPCTATLTSVSGAALSFRVGVAVRGRKELEHVESELPLPHAVETVDGLRDELLRLSAEPADKGSEPALAPGSSAALLRLPGATDDWSLPRDLWLNTTPYPREVREMVYSDVAAAVQAAVADPACPRRMRLLVAPPELNMEMDSYRVGSMLELVRKVSASPPRRLVASADRSQVHACCVSSAVSQVSLDLAACGLRTRVCVQGSMGEGVLAGVPRVLAGVSKLLGMMDWQAGEGEPNEGLLGAGAADGLVRFGAIGGEEVAPDDDVLLVLAPQSMVGAPIVPPLEALSEAAVSQGSAVVLINPLLQDRQSSSGVMGVRGRAERLAFAESFAEIYHFRLLYSGTTFMYPILGALRMARQDGRRVLYRRLEGGGGEQYLPVGCWVGREPTPREMSELLPSTVGSGEARGESAAAPPGSATGSADGRMPWD